MTPAGRMAIASCFVFFVSACEQDLPRTEYQVGEHRISLRPPRGWRYLDHGHEKLFQRGASRLLHVIDLGPITGEGYAREVKSARAAYLEGRATLARERLSGLRMPRDLLASKEAFDHYLDLLDAAMLAVARDDEPSVLPALDALRAVLDDLAPPSRRVLLELTLERVGGHETWRREIESEEEIEVGGRPGLIVKTWDKRTHETRWLNAFVVNGGRLLAVRTSGYGEGEAEAARAFAGVVGSLELVSPDTPG